MNTFYAWLKRFMPGPVMASRKERIYGCIGACAGLIFAILLSEGTLGKTHLWFVAPMGASAVLLFAVPSSPLAQPWSIIGGNLVAALIGVTCAQWLGVSAVSAGVAVAAAIGVMFMLRCLHPPSGAVALMSVMGGPDVLSLGYRFALWPVAVNSLFLLVAALLINYALGRRYPHQHVEPANPHKTKDSPPEERVGFTRADLDRALEEHSALLDVYDDDLQEILQRAEFHAFRRRSGDIQCMHVMSRDVVQASPRMTVAAALKLMTTHKVSALPVIDARNELAGMANLSRVAEQFAMEAAERDPHSMPLETVMDPVKATASPQQALLDLLPFFSDEGQHTVPVVDKNQRLVGVLTQSDVIAALYRTRVEEDLNMPSGLRRTGNEG